MSEIFIIIRKEFWEWRYSLKKLAMLAVIFLLPLIAYKTEGSIFVAASSVGGVLIILASIGSISFITSESILAEKKNKTLEFLLSTRLSPLSIVLGKIIPGLIIGSILAIIIFIIFLEMSMIGLTDVSVILVINFLQFTFLAGLIAFIATLVIPDEKILQITSILILIAILGILKGLTLLNFNLSSFMTIPVLLLMNTMTTIFAKKLLVTTKLFLKI